jgi:hypothetical protein
MDEVLMEDIFGGFNVFKLNTTAYTMVWFLSLKFPVSKNVINIKTKALLPQT